MEKKENGDRYRAPALDKGLDILELLARQPGGMTRAEIVSAMGRSPSEVYRMVERLVAREYVRRSLAGDRFTLSMKLFLLGSSHPPLRRLISYAQPLMDEFANKTLQSIHLAIPEAGSAVVVAQASGPANWEFRLRVGAELSLISTGSGKTLLAYQDDDGLKELFPPSEGDTSSTILQDPQLVKELEEIKRTGYRISDSGQLVGVTDISVATIGSNGNAFGVLTCPYIERVGAENTTKSRTSIEETKMILLELKEQISIS
jgi:DNA-binding IclR family transcriptional regulator